MPIELALALAPDHLTAVAVRAGPFHVDAVGRHATPLAPPADDGSWPALAEALVEVCRALAIPEGAPASLALLPPIARAKVASLPGLAPAALDQLVQRDGRRHFAGLAGAAPLVYGVAGPAAPGALVACADARVITAATEAANAAGVRLDQATAAAPALVAAALAGLPAARRGRVALAAAGPGWAVLVRVEDGRTRLVLDLTGLSPADAAALAAGPLPDGAAVGTGSGGAVAHAALAVGDGAAALAAAATGPDAARLVLERSRVLGELSAAELAAIGAALARPRRPVLLPNAGREAWQRRAARRAARVGAGAVAVLGLVAAAHLWGLGREVDALRARRSALAPVVGPAIAARQRVDAAQATLVAIARLDERGPHWTKVMTTLAGALPDSAYLVTFTGSGTSARLSGLAVSAHSVVRALADRPTFRDVTIDGPVLRVGDAGLERFELSLGLRPRGPGGTADGTLAGAPSAVARSSTAGDEP